MKKYRIILKEILFNPEEESLIKKDFVKKKMGIDLITLQDDIPYSVLCDKLKFNFDRLIKEYILSKGE